MLRRTPGAGELDDAVEVVRSHEGQPVPGWQQRRAAVAVTDVVGLPPDVVAEAGRVRVRGDHSLVNETMINLPVPSVVVSKRYGSLLVVPSFCTKRTVAVTAPPATRRGFSTVTDRMRA